MQATRGASLSDADPAPPPRRIGLFVVVAATVYLLDQLTKVAAVAFLTPGVPAVVVPGVLQLDLFRNPGAAFSIATGMTVVFSLVAVVVVGLVIRTARRLRSRGWAVALGLVLGGAMGNLTDRLVRSPGPFRGWVVDFLQLPHWPVFNLADSAIVTGAVLLVVITLTGRGLDGSRSDR
ncbi:MAG: signal peptidase II [Actinomycetes bacterium]